MRATTRIGRTATLLALCGALGCGYFEPRGLANVSGLKRAAGSAPPAVTRIKTPAPRREPSPREIIDELNGDTGPLRRGEYAIRYNRTLMYPVRWLRAEGMADTLQDLLSAQYGPNVRVVTHPETNNLFIYLPPHSEWQSGRSVGGRTGSAPGRSTGRTSSAGRGTTSRATTNRGSTSPRR